VSRLKNFWALAAVIATLVFLYSLLPLGTALQFGGDEGYQLITGFLMSKGYALYKQIWDDQPPVFVLLLDWAFKNWGPSILAARLMAAGFGLVLFGGLYQLASQRIGRRAAFLAPFFLLSSPAILELSVSVMQEVPAFALALASVLLLFQWCKKPRWWWLPASGAVMGVALGTKLTAVLVVPAMFVEIWLKFSGKREPALIKKIAIPILQWGVATGTVFTVITLIWGRGGFQSSYRAHFAEHAIYGMQRPEDFPMPFSVFLDHAECVIAAAVGLILAFRCRKLRDFAFPIVMLLTVLSVHTIHRPWWTYYYLHIAIPMAWLAGFAASEAITHVSNLLSRSRFNPASKIFWNGVGLCVLIGLVFVRSEGRLEDGMKNLRQRERVDASPILAMMREYAGHTHWVYVQFTHEIYPFHAQFPMPPELAMVTMKRFWSDQISNEEIVEICRRYKPEQLLLNAEQANDAWGTFLNDYTIVYQDKNFNLYVLKQPN
jgi:4-amino-4-deoxy-L-arabinose transferase-like glycosyltransferase